MLNKLNKKIITGDIWDSEYLCTIDIDDILDMRDEKEFDSEWVRIYNMIQNKYVENDNTKIIDSIRENVFTTLYDRVGDSDLSAYISDDFELMCKSYVMNINDAWLASLVNEYIQKKIPYGKLNKNFLNYKELFEKLCESN